MFQKPNLTYIIAAPHIWGHRHRGDATDSSLALRLLSGVPHKGNKLKPQEAGPSAPALTVGSVMFSTHTDTCLS